ncbi:MAG: glycosyltransferase family 4 protein, partial [Limisphaerales bacterium]
RFESSDVHEYQRSQGVRAGKGNHVKLLFVHQTLGQFGGAEINIHLAAEELGRRGCAIDLLYREKTGRGEPAWAGVFGSCLRLPNARRAEFIRGIVREGKHELIYLHNLADLEVIEALLDSGVPVARMVHDHSLYCMRTYKYNYFTRNICTRPASGYCVFPCLASLARNHVSAFPIRWASYREKRNEIALNRRCCAFVVYSEYQKRELIQNGFDARKIEVCAPVRALNPAPTPGTGPKRNLILYAGQVIRGKGVDSLLKALARVSADFQCLIFGDGNHKTHCEKLSRKLGLDGRVEFRGYCPPSKLRRHYLEARVFVMSSLWPEPFGMSGPEAMRYGLPVVAFDAGGIREWLIDGENGYLVRWNDVAQFAARIDDLLRNPDRAAQLGRRARERMARYDAGHQIDNLLALFQRVARVPSEDRAPALEFQQSPVCL